MKKYTYPLYVLIHPVDGFEEMRWKKSGSITISVILLIAWFIVAILSYEYTGFNFNRNRPDSLNVFLILLTTIFPFVLWVISNWCFCTLLDGEGTFKNIWIVSAYSLIPYMLFSILIVVLSRVLILEEAVFLTWLMYIGQIWSAALIIIGLKVIHQYTFGKTMGSVLLTLLGILIIVFLIILGISLIQQLFAFVRTVYSEFRFRIS